MKSSRSLYILRLFTAIFLFSSITCLGWSAEEGLSPRDFLKLYKYTKKDVDDWFSGDRYSFAKYDSELGMLHRDRRYKEGVNDSYCVYSYDDQDARRGFLYADQPCRIHAYGSAFAGGEQVNDGETWEEALAAHLCEPIKNFGVGGFSTYTAYLRMKHVEPQDPAPYLIFNLAKGDHGFNLIG